MRGDGREGGRGEALGANRTDQEWCLVLSFSCVCVCVWGGGSFNEAAVSAFMEYITNSAVKKGTRGCLLGGVYVPCIYRISGGVIVGDSGICCCVRVC